LPELAAFAALVESAGLDGVGVPDHHHTGRDAYLALGAMASTTSRISLYPATSNTVTRQPLVLAALANSLDELAPGRAFLTVAPGFLSVEKAGQPQEPRQRLGEVVLALRGLLEAGAATFDGHELELSYRPTVGSRVILLASGPRLLELAGEMADGGWRHDDGRVRPTQRASASVAVPLARVVTPLAWRRSSSCRSV